MTWETERNAVRAMLSEEFSRRDFPEKQTAAIIEKGRPTLLLDWLQLKKVSETFSFIYWYCNGLIATASRLVLDSTGIDSDSGIDSVFG